jgi:hypothetical protein
MAGIVLNRSRQAPAEDTPAFGGIAERFRRAGELDRAITLCREGLKRFPGQLSARVTLGWALLDKGRYDEARDELEQVLRRAPDNLAAIRGLAELHDRAESSVPNMESGAAWASAAPEEPPSIPTRARVEEAPAEIPAFETPGIVIANTIEAPAHIAHVYEAPTPARHLSLVASSEIEIQSAAEAAIEHATAEATLAEASRSVEADSFVQLQTETAEIDGLVAPLDLEQAAAELVVEPAEAPEATSSHDAFGFDPGREWDIPSVPSAAAFSAAEDAPSEWTGSQGESLEGMLAELGAEPVAEAAFTFTALPDAVESSASIAEELDATAQVTELASSLELNDETAFVLRLQEIAAIEASEPLEPEVVLGADSVQDHEDAIDASSIGTFAFDDAVADDVLSAYGDTYRNDEAEEAIARSADLPDAWWNRIPRTSQPPSEPPAIAALEDFLRKIEARRQQVVSKSVA